MSLSLEYTPIFRPGMISAPMHGQGVMKVSNAKLRHLPYFNSFLVLIPTYSL